MRERPLFLALDVGTSSTRALLYDAEGKHVRGASSQIAYDPQTTADGGAEMDADWLVEQVCETIDQVARHPSFRRVIAVAASSFWHSLLGVDAAGKAATPVYLWLDARSRGDAEALNTTLDSTAIHARTGCVLHWSYWPAKLQWLRRTNHWTDARVRRWLSFDEYLHLKLFGSAAGSLSMASGTGLLNQHTCTWDAELLKAASISEDCLAPRAESQAGLSHAFASRWPQLARVPWRTGLGDGASSNVGAACTTPDRTALMIGTSGALRVVVRTDTFTIPPGAWCYRLDERRIVLGGAINDGGSLISWLSETFRMPSIREAQRQAAAMPPDSHGLTVLPFWGGERSPHWAADARGTLFGLRLHTSSVAILRACMEAVALKFRELDRVLADEVPDNSSVVATGGALLNAPLWQQIIADVLDKPVYVSAIREASSRGAVLMASEALGLLHAPLETLDSPVRSVVRPDPSTREAYRAASERQRALYDVLIGQDSGIAWMF